MRSKTYLAVSSALGACGVLFAGTLSGIKMRSGICAFNEPCPEFLGYPACYTGFGLFVLLFVPAALALAASVTARWPLVANLVVSGLGVLFAGTITLREVIAHAGVPTYGMGLPTCAYGLIFFIGILVLSITAIRRFEHPRP
jgi:hypothetical protein